jgi:hypothetical protein
VEITSPKICLLSLTTATAVSSQLVSIPKISRSGAWDVVGAEREDAGAFLVVTVEEKRRKQVTGGHKAEDDLWRRRPTPLILQLLQYLRLARYPCGAVGVEG